MMNRKILLNTDDDDKHFLFFMQGDEKGLQYFMQQWHKELSIYAKKIPVDEFEIGTVIQDAFLNVWVNRSNIKVKDATHLFYYTRQQVKWLCYSALRKLKRQQTVALEPYEYQLMDTYDSAAVIEQQQYMQAQEDLLEQAIAYLPEEMETIVTLWKKGFNPHRIAQIQHTSTQYIVSKIKKSIPHLKRILYRLEKAALATAKRPQLVFSDYKVYLDNQQAQIFRHYYEETCSPQQIAGLLNLTLFQVQQQHKYIKNIIDKKPKII